MKPHLTSISDIAKALGVSASTVSRALKDHPDISEATREKIKAFAVKVNYRPNALALSLKKQVSHTIGIVIPEIVHHFFSSIISGIEDIAYSKGYRVMICQSNEDFRREEMNVEALLDHRVDGLLVCTSKSTEDFSHFLSVYRSQIPMVFFDRVCKEIDTDRVITDDFNGARLITSHLIETGCRKILHLGTQPRLHIGQERLQGYMQALKDNNLPFVSELTLNCDTPQSVMEHKDIILSMADKIDGVFAVNDSTAITAMHILRENGYRIPEDISIAGFGDDPVANLVFPTLTTLEQQGYHMGQEAMKLLLERLSQTDTELTTRVKVFQPELKKRNSTKSIPAK
ncbi:MAG: LacI family transcriptional regulator [Bacteroidetes bacterium]|nr:MAG: LacI family transcriptional regulator [Bacteroidota bacterium]